MFLRLGVAEDSERGSTSRHQNESLSNVGVARASADGTGCAVE